MDNIEIDIIPYIGLLEFSEKQQLDIKDTFKLFQAKIEKDHPEVSTSDSEAFSIYLVRLVIDTIEKKVDKDRFDV